MDPKPDRFSGPFPNRARPVTHSAIGGGGALNHTVAVTRNLTLRNPSRFFITHQVTLPIDFFALSPQYSNRHHHVPRFLLCAINSM